PLWWVKEHCDASLHLEANQPRRSEDRRVNAPALHFAQSRRNVTPQLHRLEIGPVREQLRSSPKTGRADARAGRQSVQILSARLPIDHKHIARVFTLKLRDNLQTIGRLGRQ